MSERLYENKIGQLVSQVEDYNEMAINSIGDSIWLFQPINFENYKFYCSYVHEKPLVPNKKVFDLAIRFLNDCYDSLF